MNALTWTGRWWEAIVVVLAANSVVYGVIEAGDGYPEWAIGTGFAPAALLLAGAQEMNIDPATLCSQRCGHALP